MLMREDGEFITACFGRDFFLMLQSEDLVLAPGTYCVMVDPIWNEIAKINSYVF